MNNCRILIVDDEPRLRKLVALNLKSLGYDVECAVDGAAALKAFDKMPFDLILLDLMMPKIDGFSVLEQIRHVSSVPIIILTAKDALEDKIRGFDLGADDYLQKPFALEELFGRVRAVLRRSAGRDEPLSGQAAEIVNGPIRVALSEHRVWVKDREIRLTATEFKLLAYFMRHVDTVSVHEQILAHVWGPDRDADLQYLRVTLARLRQKLRDAGMTDDCGIVNYSGIGYLMKSLRTT